MLRKNGTALQCKPGEPLLSFRRPNWPTYRFYDVPDGPLSISFFFAALLPLEPPLPKNRIAVSASPSIAPPPRRSRDGKRELSASL
jgi:hypothetical protein